MQVFPPWWIWWRLGGGRVWLSYLASWKPTFSNINSYMWCYCKNLLHVLLHKITMGILLINTQRNQWFLINCCLFEILKDCWQKTDTYLVVINKHEIFVTHAVRFCLITNIFFSLLSLVSFCSLLNFTKLLVSSGVYGQADQLQF